MSPNPSRSTDLSLAQQAELRKMARMILLRDPLLALRLLRGREPATLAKIDELARKYKLPAGIIAAALAVLAATAHHYLQERDEANINEGINRMVAALLRPGLEEQADLRNQEG